MNLGRADLATDETSRLMNLDTRHLRLMIIYSMNLRRLINHFPDDIS